MDIERIIEERLKQHRDNFAGWKEGKSCHCWHRVFGANPKCVDCGGSGEKEPHGFLLHTEPDPDERELIRRDLKTAISELEWLQQRLIESQSSEMYGRTSA